MFNIWKKRPKALQSESPPVPSQPPKTLAGGEDGAGSALAGPARDEPPARVLPQRNRRRTPAERAELLAKHASSGLSDEDFCEQHGIKLSTFKVWARRARPKADPRFSKRFSPDERRAAVEAFAKSGRSRPDFARLWGCSPSSLDKWTRRYEAEGPKGLETRVRQRGPQRDHAKRISDSVRALIIKIRTENEEYGAQRVVDDLNRFHGVKVSASVVRKILKENGIAGQPFPHRRKRAKSKLPRRFERSKPGEMWQSDITSFVLRRQGRRVYLTVFLDDHSRYIVAWMLATHQRTPLVTEPLLEGIARFGKPQEVLTDQGRQYFAWRGKSGFQKLLAKEGIQHVVSRTHHPQTLGKCERLWKSIGDEFWDRAVPQDLDDARKRLGHWIRHYNHFRPHQGIDGLVPADRFFEAESSLRAGLEKELSKNELQLSLKKSPRQPVYLVGQIGEQRIALHGERGRLVINTPDGGRREISMHDLGVERQAKHTNETKRTENGNSSERDGIDGTEPESETEAGADGTQALGVHERTEGGLAGSGSMGERAAGGEAHGARDVYADPGVLAGQEDEGGGGGGSVDHAAARLAAEPASSIGNDGRPSDATSQARGAGGVRGSAGTVADGLEEAHRGTREGAVSDGGSGASAENCPVGELGNGILTRRVEACTQNQSEAQGESQERRGCESVESSGKGDSRGRRFMRWVKRMK